MITFMDPKDKLKEPEKCLDSKFWHACAGSMVQMPPVNSKVFYFPQGHAELACGNVEFKNLPKMSAYVACTVSAIKFMADLDTDEVYTKIRLIPIISNEINFDDDGFSGNHRSDPNDKPTSFAKTLTQSDANNGGGFSVPRFCAETILPRLDYSADPPVQTILAKDVNGETWKFRHIYRGTPRRHLLTTGWSTFVNHKKLVAGDSIVFLRRENGNICVGIRRAKRGIGGGPELASGWNPTGGNCVEPYGGYSAYDDENKLRNSNDGGHGGGNFIGKGRVSAESVIEAATLAANGQPFEIVYYPRASTPEFCVKASLIKSALQIRWRSGMRFKMPFETEDSSRISWFMGTISSVQVADPIRWPDSPWRLLQVTWDEPDLLQNVKYVNPWLVEIVSNMSTIHLLPFSPPPKKLRLPHHPDFPLDDQLQVPTFSGNLFGQNRPFGCLLNNTPAGMQGARHAQYGLPLSDLPINKMQPVPFLAGFPQFDHGAVPTRTSNNPIINEPNISENISCLLSMGNSNQTSNTIENRKAGQFFLFGQPILTEKQISLSCSGDTVSPDRTRNSYSEEDAEKMANNSDGDGSGVAVQWYTKDNYRKTERNLETGHCKVFMESDDIGRTLDLSLLASYEELYNKLASMFGVDSSEIINHVLYRDVTGDVKQVGDEAFSDFAETARRLTILTDSSSNNVRQ